MASGVPSTGALSPAPNSPVSSPRAGLSRRISGLSDRSSPPLADRAAVLAGPELEAAPPAFVTADFITVNLRHLESPIKDKQIEAAKKTAACVSRYLPQIIGALEIIPRGTIVSRFRTLTRTVLSHLEGLIVVFDNRNNIFAKREGIFARGGFKTLYRGIDAKTGKVFAIARLDKNAKLVVPSDGPYEIYADNFKLIQQELVYFKKFENVTGIAQVEVVYESASEVYIVMKYEEYGDPMNYMKNVCHSHFLPTNQLLTSARRMLEGLIEVHRQGIIHRDIKPENFLAYRETLGEGSEKREVLRADLADLGLAIPEDQIGSVDREGALRYFAPEVRFGQLQSKASDLYAFGLTLFELFASTSLEELPHKRFFPQQRDRDGRLYVPKKITSSTYSAWVQATEQEYYRYLDEILSKRTPAERAISNVIRRLLDLDPAQRGTAQQALDDLMGYITLAESLRQPGEVA